MSLFHQHYPGDSVSTAFSIFCRSCHPFTFTTNPQSASARHGKNSFRGAYNELLCRLTCRIYPQALASNKFDEPMGSWVERLYGGVGGRIKIEYEAKHLLSEAVELQAPSKITVYLAEHEVSRYPHAES